MLHNGFILNTIYPAVKKSKKQLIYDKVITISWWSSFLGHCVVTRQRRQNWKSL